MARRSWAPKQRVMLLAYIMLLALCLRIYRLDEQSVWFDEFNAILIDPAASFSTFMRHIHMSNPDHVPLYFVLMYAWGKYVSVSALSMRLVSVVFGCLTIPMVYRIGRDVSGWKAGLVAALCVALSPFNVHFSQEIRCNALLAFLATVSVWLTLLSVKRPSWRATVAHAAINTVMVFTHLSSAFLIIVEFAFLVFASVILAGPLEGRPTGPTLVLPGKTARQRLLLWAGLHVPSALQCLFWIHTFGGMENIWYDLPKPIEWLTDLLGDDAVRRSQEFGFTMLGAITDQFPRNAPLAIMEDAAYLTVMLAAVVWGIVRLIRHENWRGDADARASALRWLFIMVLLAGPLVVITIASVLWHPIALPRYTMYSSFGLYVLVGGMVMSPGSTKKRLLALALVVGVYLPQLAFMLPNYTRPDWKGAGRIIQENYKKGDMLFALRRMPDESRQVPEPAELLTYNMDAPKLHFSTAYSYKGILDQSSKFLGEDEGPDSVWLVIDPFNGYRRRPKFEKRLSEFKLAYTHWQTTNLHIYKIWRQNVDKAGAPPGAPMQPTDEDLMHTYLPECGEGPACAEGLQALRWSVPQIETAKDLEYSLRITAFRAMELSPATGRAMAERVLKQDPDDYAALRLLNCAAIALRDPETARAALEKFPPYALEVEARDAPGVEAFMVGDFAKARALAKEYSALAPSRLPPFFRYALGMETPPLGSHLVPLP